MRFQSRILGTVSFAALAIAGFSTPAFAQDEDAPDGTPLACAEIQDDAQRAACVAAVAGPQNPEAAGAEPGAIEITGSRIRRPNLQSTVPITSVGTEEILDSGNLNLGDALSQLPSLRSTFTQANSTRFIGTAGLNRLDLRGLGTGRTLVLVNGRRHVTSEPGSTIVDVNNIPIDLLERVDIVTGGNSAIYGSDAVSGVVNFILRRDYDGISLRGQAGVSERGDRGSYFAAAIWGRNFADDRANITFAAEYSRLHRLMLADRPEQTGAFDGQPGFLACDLTTLGTDPDGAGPLPAPDFREPPEGDGIPDNCFFNPGSRFNNISLTGFISTACPAPTATNAARRAAVCTGVRSQLNQNLEFSRNYLFSADGTRVIEDPITHDFRRIGGPRLGGLSATGIEDSMLLPGFERVALSALFNVELSSAFHPFAEATYNYITANQTSVQPSFTTGLAPPFSATVVGLNSAYFITNPFLTPEARATIVQILGISPTTGAFQALRFNNDIGTRAEDHNREVMRIVAGFRGDLSPVWNYEISGNFGRSETYYETGGNIHLQRWANATIVERNAAGQIVCSINNDANLANDDPACAPLNPFGFAQMSPQSIAYVLHTGTRDQWAEQLQLVAFVSGDTSGFFELPGGPIGIAAGLEYRTEDAFSAYDPVTTSGATFLNAIGAFDPETQRIKEAFGEIRLPILRDVPFFNELTLEAAARVSDYNTLDEVVWAYNVGLIWSPIPDIRFRGGYARSVRAPDLGDLFSTQAETFSAAAFLDPCDQNQIIVAADPALRRQRCADAGIPTTITLPTGETIPWTNVTGSSVSGFSQGNPDLQPEVGTSWTLGAVIQPRFLPGFALTIDYHNIEIEEAIAALTAQEIVNRCYDDPVTLDNPFCAAQFRRRTPGNVLTDFTWAGQSNRRFPGASIPIPGCNPGNQNQCEFSTVGPGFIQSGFNFQRLRSEGIDFDLSYRRNMFGIGWDVRAIVSWLMNREFFVFISDPTRSERQHGVLGDPEWAAALAVNADLGDVELQYDMRFIDRQSVDVWETQHTHQGRGPTNADRFPFAEYPRVFYHDIRVNFEPTRGFRFYAGVDNVFDRLPPFGLTGTGAGSGIFPVQGRYFYSGVRIDF
jgi:outer membrane receptor protein involved in Fe transport